MRFRELGKTGIAVSEISMGCNRLGEDSAPDQHWIDLVRRAVDLGVTLFDTSESYGWGRSEEMLGHAIGNDSTVLIATKVSRERDTGIRNFAAERMMASAEASLQRLRRDHIDVLQLHSPSLEQLQTCDWPEGMRRLQEQGKVRLAGVSVNDAASAKWLFEHRLADVIQLPYNIIEHAIGDEILPLAQEAGAGTLIRMPMARGVLTGKFRPGAKVATGHRAQLVGDSLETFIARAEALKPLARQAGLPMVTLALRYAITPRGVSAAIPGARTLDQLEQNVAASNAVGLSAALIDQITRIRSRW